MTDSTTKKHKGIAALFDNIELKTLFKNYLILLGISEVFIFFVSFLSQLGPENIPFPWRSYFFAAFIIPIAITFILGLCIMGFNTYLYGNNFDNDPAVPLFDIQGKENQSWLYKFQVFIHSIRQIPLLMALIILGLCAGIIYKIDDILIFIGHAGEKTAQYLLISLAVVLAVATVFGFVWMILNYNLRKKQIEFEHQYKSKVIEHSGLIILDDNRVIDTEGNIIASKTNTTLISKPKNNSKNLSILPSLTKDNNDDSNTSEVIVS